MDPILISIVIIIITVVLIFSRSKKPKNGTKKDTWDTFLKRIKGKKIVIVPQRDFGVLLDYYKGISNALSITLREFGANISVFEDTNDSIPNLDYLVVINISVADVNFGLGIACSQRKVRLGVKKEAMHELSVNEFNKLFKSGKINKEDLQKIFHSLITEISR